MGLAAFGAEFWFDDASGTPTMVGELLSVEPPAYSSTFIDTTHHASAEGITTGIPSGKREVSTIAISIQVDPGSTEDVMLQTAARNARVGTYKCVIPGSVNPQGYSGEGYIATYKIGAAATDGKLTADITIQPTGAFSQADA